MKERTRSTARVTLAIALLTCAACSKDAREVGAATDGASARLANAADVGQGCRDNSACGANEYCEFKPGLCGKGKIPGACRAKPESCPAQAFSPVCACDGNSYDSECAAHAAGVDLAVMGGCKRGIPDWGPCGKHYCDARRSYCEIFLSDVFEIPTDYFCRALPPSCLPETGVARTCDCFAPGTRCLSFCGPLVTGGGVQGFHLTCQGVSAPAN